MYISFNISVIRFLVDAEIQYANLVKRLLMLVKINIANTCQFVHSDISS